MSWQRRLVPSHAKRFSARMGRRVPRRLLRNLGLFYLILATMAGLLVLGRVKPGFHRDIWHQVQYGFRWFRDKSIPALAALVHAVPLTSDLSRSILAEGLPGGEIVGVAGSQLSSETLRSIVQVVTDYDLAEPESLVAAAFPGSRSTTGSVRWDWVIQRSIEGYGLGGASQASDTRGADSLESPSDSLGSTGTEVIITAPEYVALTTVESDQPPVSEDGVKIVTYDSRLVQTQSTPGSVSPAARQDSLARVNWGNAPLVAIYHTHTGETYRDAAGNSSKSYAWDIAQPGAGLVPGVVQVGERLTRELQRRYGIPVVHSGKVHDYPVFAYSYSNSEKTAQMLVERYPSLQLVLDIHRDEGKTLETLQGKQLSGVLIVVATGDATGLIHGNWQQNLEIAQLLKENFDRLYPGLCRGLLVKERARYNQHLHRGALLLEIGAHSDTLDSALMTAELVADVLAETLWQMQSGSRGRDGIRAVPQTPSLIEIFEPQTQRSISR